MGERRTFSKKEGCFLFETKGYPSLLCLFCMKTQKNIFGKINTSNFCCGGKLDEEA